MESASAMVHSKSLIDGTDQEPTGTVIVSGASSNNTATIEYGYPNEKWLNTWENLLDIDTTDEFSTEETATTFYVYPQGYNAPIAGNPAGTCFASYTKVGAAFGTPTITTDTSGC
jgi:hypothetical protein